MNIGIDARLLERRITGIGRVLILILEKLPEVDSQNKYFLFSYGQLVNIDKFYTNISTVKSFIPQKLFSPIWNNFILPNYLKKNKIDIFFSVNQIIPLVKGRTTKYISVVHDVIYKADKKFLPVIYRKYLQFFAYFSVKNSEVIITDSHYSKQDILKNYRVDEKKIKVIYSSANEEFHSIDLTSEEIRNLKEKYRLPKYVVLYVGMIENRKNIIGILNIADIISKKNTEVGFLLIGKIGHGGKELLKEINKRKNVSYLGSVGDQELKTMYNIASVFLFPSFYEGFGFPPLEAMQSGLPVLSSNNTSLKEIVGSGGIMYDALDYNSFVEDILKLIEDKAFYERMRQKGFEHAKKFNINNTVKELVGTFNSIKTIS